MYIKGCQRSDPIHFEAKVSTALINVELRYPMYNNGRGIKYWLVPCQRHHKYICTVTYYYGQRQQHYDQ